MRVAMYYNNNDVRIEEMPIPEIGPGELLVRVKASGICGSDVMEWYRIKKAPLVLGHEISGEIAAVGEGVKNFKENDRISASHHVPCYTCYYCLNGHHTVCDTLRQTNFYPGGFADYVRIPSINVNHGVYLIPGEVSFEEATFAEPLACVLRGLKIANFQPGKSILVFGSGISGLLFVKLTHAFGAARIIATDIIPYRLDAAKNFGADFVINANEYSPAYLRNINGGRLADLVIVSTGATNAFTQALNSVERGGTILFFAPTDPGVTIPLSINDVFWRNDITLTTSYAGSPADHITALELIHSRRIKVNDMITHRLSLEETALGFKLVSEAKNSIKVIIEP
ncbi:MAG: zinc-dependent dehydrogenase [Acidobacteriota bacterium]